MSGDNVWCIHPIGLYEDINELLWKECASERDLHAQN